MQNENLELPSQEGAIFTPPSTSKSSLEAIGDNWQWLTGSEWEW